MSANWPLHSLSDFINVKHGFAFKGEFFKAERTSDLLVTPGNFAIGGGFKSDKFKFYEGPVPEDYVLSEGDVIVTMTDLSKQADTLGYSALVPKVAGSRLLHNQRVGLIEFKNDELDKTYLYFLLRSKEYRHHVVSTATGSTVKHSSPTKILSFSFRKPPKDIQIDIGKKLIALEEKIENNTQTNQTLEQIAQALFKSWFVDFDPVKAKIETLAAGGSADDAELAAMGVISAKTLDELNGLKASNSEAFNKLAQTAALFPDAMQDSELGEIPEGWEVGLLSSEIEVLNGFAFKSGDYEEKGTFVLRTKNFDNGIAKRLQDDVFLPKSFLESHKKYLCQPFDYHLVMVGASVGNRGMLYPDLLPAFRNQNMWCFRPKQDSDISRPQVKFILDTLIAKTSGLASGSAREFFRKGDFQNQMICFGSKEIRELFAAKTTPLFEELASLYSEQRLLSEMRDSLLPKLLAGEIDLTSEVIE